jgi:hypothetical protein
MADCESQMPGTGACNQCPPDCGVYGTPCPPGCSPDCGFTTFLLEDVTKTVQDAAGQVWTYGNQALNSVGSAALGIGILIVAVFLLTRRA